MAYVNVDIDLGELDIDDLIKEVESAGYKVIEEKEAVATTARVEDLRSDFITWKEGAMTDYAFENILKKFFVDTIGDYIL